MNIMPLNLKSYLAVRYAVNAGTNDETSAQPPTYKRVFAKRSGKYSYLKSAEFFAPIITPKTFLVVRETGTLPL